MPQKESREPVRPLPAGGAGSHRRRPKPRAPPRLLQSRKVHRRRRHSRRPLQPRLLRPHLRRKRPSQTPQLRRRTAPLTQSPLLNPRLRLQRKSRKSRQGQPILPRRNLPHPQRLRRRRKHRQRRKSQTLAPPRSSRRPHSRPRHRQPFSASSRKLMVFRSCRKDLDAYCAGVEYGDGRQLRCLESNKASLSPDCQGALAKLDE